MAFNEQFIPAQEKEDKFIIPTGVFSDPNVPTDSEVFTWVNNNVSSADWDGSVYVYDLPSSPSNGISYTYVWISVITGVSFSLINVTNRITGGPAGPSGKTILSGSLIPDGSVGTDGDFYIKKPEWNIYGPRAGGLWGGATSLVGPMNSIVIGTVTQGASAAASITPGSPAQLNLTLPQGNQGDPGNVLRSGAGIPSNSLGVDGDYYLDTNSGNLYQRVSGSYGAPVTNLKGPAGASPTMSIGTVTTVEPPSSANATITGTAPNFVLNLTIPKGVNASNPNFTATANTLNPGDSATASITGTYPNLTLTLGIPKGSPSQISVITNPVSATAYFTTYEITDNRTTLTFSGTVEIGDVGKTVSFYNGNSSGSIAITAGTLNYVLALGQTVTFQLLSAGFIVYSKS